jgi:RNA polymerase sigma-70 factor (ECF subfamily)
VGHDRYVRPDQFDRLYEKHARRIYSLLAYRTGDRALAEDLLADTFERAIRSRRSFDPARGAEKWLYTIALNLLRDHARREAAAGRAMERAELRTGAGGDAMLDAVEDRDVVARAMRALSPEESDAIALRYGADLTLAQVGRVLGIPAKAAEARVYRALRKLRDQLEEA